MTRRLALDVALLCFGILVILVIWALVHGNLPYTSAASRPAPAAMPAARFNLGTVPASGNLRARTPVSHVPVAAEVNPVASVAASIGTPIMGGFASWVRPSLGAHYLAMRLPRGTVVRICGAGCVVRRVTDYGPSRRIRPIRIADLSAVDFQHVCGPLGMGVCVVSAEILNRIPEPPATDTE